VYTASISLCASNGRGSNGWHGGWIGLPKPVFRSTKLAAEGTLRFYPSPDECERLRPGDLTGKPTILIPIFDRTGDELKPVLYVRPSCQYETLALLNKLHPDEVRQRLQAERFEAEKE
jgi:hypothetical protein